MTEVVSALFAGKKDDKKPIMVNDMEPDQAVAAINSFFEMAGKN